MTKEQELKELERQIEQNETIPLKSPLTNLVFGEGDVNARVIFIGEAPGFHEDRLKRPFVGNAGHLLNNLLERAQLRREEVYITNVVKYRPPENRDPSPFEIEAYLPYLIRQVEIIKPRFIITLGRFSLNFFLPKVKISQVHGRAFSVHGRIVIPMFHPAAALRSSTVLDLETSDFLKLPQILKDPESFLQTALPTGKTQKKIDDSQMSFF